jgi:hypothetical protein
MSDATLFDPALICPNCQTEIKLTESLAGPLLEETRQQYERLLAQQEAAMSQREAAVRDQLTAVRKAQAGLEDEVAKRLNEERQAIAASEAQRARTLLGDDLQAKAREIAELQTVLRQRDEKLAAAQAAHAELIRKQRELDDAKREIELTIERRVAESLASVRDKATRVAEDGLKLKVAERDQTIATLQRQIDELKRKAEQGSPQLRGEVLELALEDMLRAKFPLDSIEPVPKGEHGGDVLQRILNSGGIRCGTILWESKRTRQWNKDWLAKLRDDQRAAKADVCVIVTQVLPKDIETFDFVDGVWVTGTSAILPLALALRHSLLELAATRQANVGQRGKMELMYDYLVGSGFRQRVLAMVEAFTALHEDLQKEKRVITKQWAKREAQIERVMTATVGMYGDLQGIAGKSLPEIDALEPKLLEHEPDDAG